MAFTVTIIKRGIFGDQRYVQGKYVNDGGSTGGEVTTGLSLVRSFTITEQGTAVSSNRSVMNETLPLSKGDVTIVTSSNETGYFEAKGK